MNFNQVKNRYLTFDKLAKEYSDNIRNLFYVPLRDGLCIDQVCGVITSKGTRIWIDHGHITEASASELKPLLLERLNKTNFFSYIK